METNGFISAFEPNNIDKDETAGNTGSEPMYKEVVTGGFKKYFRKRKVRNPKYQKPIPTKKEASTSQQELGMKLRDARTATGLTQAQLAKLLGTHQANISKVEYGLFNPSVAYLERYGEALGKKIKISLM